MARKRRRVRLGAVTAIHELEARAFVDRALQGAQIASGFAYEGRCDLALQAMIDSEVAFGVARREARHSGMNDKEKGKLFARPTALVEGARKKVIDSCACPIERAGHTRVR